MKDWYVLRSKPKKESLAAGLLARAGIEVYLPQIKALRRRSGLHIMAPLFPGYFFSRLDRLLGEIRLATYTSGVRYIVGYNDEPCPVPEGLVVSIQERLGRSLGGLSAPRFHQGDKLSIVGGPLDGIDAIFERYLSSSGRVRVLIQILDRAWRSELPIERLRRADTE